MSVVDRQIEEYLARKSKFVSSKEFEGQGKTLVFNSNRINPNAQGKELESGIERVVNASASTLVRGLQQRLKEKPPGSNVAVLISKTGTGTDTRYVVEHANV
jgi:hypothetical protein